MELSFHFVTLLQLRLFYRDHDFAIYDSRIRACILVIPFSYRNTVIIDQLFKGSKYQPVTLGHPGLTYIFNF